jgi:hypothetical protein
LCFNGRETRPAKSGGKPPRSKNTAMQQAQIDHAKGYARLAGSYSGPMDYFDTSDSKNKSFPIKMRIESFEDGISTATKYIYAAPQYQLSVATESATADGKQWIERGTQETLTFNLTNWAEFCDGTSNWFQIERAYISIKGPGFFRRKFSVHSGELWSEKWVKSKEADPWEFSHKMTLK